MGNVLAVTGLTGKKSGGAFAEYLAEHLDSVTVNFPGGVRALVRETSDVQHLTTCLPSVDLCIGSLSNMAYLKKAFENVDTVVHIAGIKNSSSIVDAAVTCHVRRLILVHTTGIYSKYKAAGELYRQIDAYVYDICKKHDIKLTICRPTMIYGNTYDQNVVTFIKMVDKLPIMPVVNGAEYELQPVHYKDLGKAYYDILMHEEATADTDYNLSGGAPITLKKMLTVIGENLGKKVKFCSCPFPIAYMGACLIYYLTLGKIDYREPVQRLCEPRIFSYEQATNDFGYRPMNFEAGIVDEIKEYVSLK